MYFNFETVGLKPVVNGVIYGSSKYAYFLTDENEIFNLFREICMHV